MIKKEKTKVLIVDDHLMFLQGLAALLQDVDDIFLADTLTSGESALLMLEEQSIDIVIMDISMPGMDGIELNEIIKKKYPEIKTLILSTHSDRKIIDKLIKGDANGYLLKNAERDELLEAVYSLARGENYFSKEIKEKMQSAYSVKNENRTDQNLSRREIEILKLVADGYSTQEISNLLFISQHTVNSHRKSLLFKLGLKNAAGLAKYALENGIV